MQQRITIIIINLTLNGHPKKISKEMFYSFPANSSNSFLILGIITKIFININFAKKILLDCGKIGINLSSGYLTQICIELD
jgi:hypothetical protein